MTVANEVALIVFLKNAELGKVKTRLAETVGDHQALSIYRYLVNITKKTINPFTGIKYLYFSSYVDCNDPWDNVKRRSQTGTSLGQRMLNAFSEVFQDNSSAIIIGTDCPYLQPQQLNEAKEHLQADKVVIGPATDGGYYLLGMPRFIPELMADIPWSTDAVLNTTIQKLDELQLDYVLLEELSDIDYEDDWQSYCNLNQNLSELLKV